MVSIPMEQYKRLCNASIDLIKANATIRKRDILIEKANREIERLKQKLHMATTREHLSFVSSNWSVFLHYE